jgi:hypothetical protein
MLSLPVEASVPAVNKPYDWMDGYSLVLLTTEDVRTFVSVRDAVQATGARVAVAIPPRVILGWIPSELVPRISGLTAVGGVFTEPVPDALLEGMDEVTLAGVRFFNSVASGQLQEEMRKATQGLPSKPLMRDALEPPPTDVDAYLNNLRAVGFDVSHELTRLSGRGPSLVTLGNSDDMVGTVAVTLFFVESNGSIDPDQYTWTSSAVSSTVSNAIAGLSWWSSQAMGYGKSVSFTTYYYPGTDTGCQTGYEPILHPSTDAPNWVQWIMANFGYSYGDHIARVNAYNTWAKSNYGTNWAYSAFIAYNPSPAPDHFTDKYAAWAYLGGPYTHLLYRSFGWPFNLVFSHETGHIFTACDEYYQAGYGGCTSCDLCSHGINNGNCEYCNAQSVPCMMRENAQVVCVFTPGHLGWLNSPDVRYFSHSINDAGGNGNGWPDPGENVTMPVTLKNWGQQVTSVSATLTTGDPYITITSDYSAYANMLTNETATSVTPYAFYSSPETPVSYAVTFTLHISGSGYDTTSTFVVRIGQPEGVKVPTASEWILVALAFLLATVGVIAVNRRGVGQRFGGNTATT